jgi:hypothetical protein
MDENLVLIGVFCFGLLMLIFAEKGRERPSR